MQEVVGSIPIGSTNAISATFRKWLFLWDIALYQALS